MAAVVGWKANGVKRNCVNRRMRKARFAVNVIMGLCKLTLLNYNTVGARTRRGTRINPVAWTCPQLQPAAAIANCRDADEEPTWKAEQNEKRL